MTSKTKSSKSGELIKAAPKKPLMPNYGERAPLPKFGDDAMPFPEKYKNDWHMYWALKGSAGSNGDHHFFNLGYDALPNKIGAPYTYPSGDKEYPELILMGMDKKKYEESQEAIRETQRIDDKRNKNQRSEDGKTVSRSSESLHSFGA